MGVRILYDPKQGEACFFCSTSGWAFGPTFGDGGKEQEYRDGQERLRFRCPVDKIEVAGLTLAKPYYQFLREMALDKVLRRDIDPKRLAEKAIQMLRTRSPLPGMTLKGVHG